MKGQYIKELLLKLENTEIWHENINKYLDYDEGVEVLVGIFMEHKESGSQVFFIGNGGSCAIASHMTADFMKNGGMNTCSLSDNAVLTCMGNDYGYENVFSQSMRLLVKKGDLVVAISSSGNSKNIVNAIHTARQKGAAVVTFTGFRPENTVKQMGDINVYVPCEKYGIVESIHNLMLQQIVDTMVERNGAGL